MTEYTQNVGKESAYYHICNSGISITIDKQEISQKDADEPFYICPVLAIYSNSYGVKMGETKIPVRPGDLRLLGEWLIRESENVKEHYKRGSNDFSFRINNNENPDIFLESNSKGEIETLNRKDYFGSGSEGSETDDSDDEAMDECCDCDTCDQTEPAYDEILMQIRLQALSHAHGVSHSPTELLETAKEIESYILNR